MAVFLWPAIYGVQPLGRCDTPLNGATFYPQRKNRPEAGFRCAVQSSFFAGHLGVVGNQCHQGILLTTRQLAKTLQQLALVQGQLAAV